MNRQDRQGARTPADLEYRYKFGKSFKEVMGAADDARTAAEDARLAAQKIDLTMTSKEIFNRLTNYGAAEGIYRDAYGNIYVNASYIQSGEMNADLIKTGSLDAGLVKIGVMQSKNGGISLNLDEDVLRVLADGKVVFKADGDGVMMCVNANSVFEVTKDGASIAGWEANKDFLGREESGLNGNADILGTSAKYKAFAAESKLRFYAGVNDDTAIKYKDVTGTVNSLGYFDVTVPVSYMVANTEAHQVNSVWYGSTALIDSEIDSAFTAVRVDDKTLRIVGKVSTAFMNSIGKSSGNFQLTAKIKYDIKIPAYQVLDDGTLIAKYAVLGGYDIRDLVARIEALEKGG